MPRKMFIELSKVPVYLARVIDDRFDGNQSAFARYLGVSRQAVYQFLQGENLPSREMLLKVGLELVCRVNTELADAELPKGRGSK